MSNRFLLPKVFGSQAFEPDSEYNRHNHFQTFMAGLLVLFRWVLLNQHPVLPSSTVSYFYSSSFLTTCYYQHSLKSLTITKTVRGQPTIFWNVYWVSKQVLMDNNLGRKIVISIEKNFTSKSCWITLYVVVILTVVTVKLDIVIALLPSFPFVCTAIQFVYRCLATSS